MKKVKEITVFFPCYNEEENIASLIEKTFSVLSKTADTFEVIVVNDGSADRTREIVEKLTAKYSNLKLINHEKNSGYGAALRTGFKNAQKELVFYTDGDNQFDIAELPVLLPLLAKADIISAYRKNRQDPLIRKLNAGLYNMVIRFLFGLRLKDIDCAFKLYRRELFDKIEITSDGALVDAEILVKAKRLGYKISQVGVSHYPRTAGKQTGADLKVILRAFKELLRLRLKLSKKL